MSFSNATMSPAFTYDGGKVKLRSWLVEHFPRRGRIYLEPFAGRGNVYWLAVNHCLFERWWLNDVRTVPFFEAIKTVDVNRIPAHVHQCEIELWKKMAREGDDLALVMSPKIVWAGGFDPLTTTFVGTWNKKFSSIKYAHMVTVARQILEKTKCELTCNDFDDLPWDEFTEDDFIYLDPPYAGVDVNSYAAGDLNHELLIQRMLTTRARWLLSEYRRDIYVNAFGEPAGIKVTYATMSNSRKFNAGRRDKRLECIWKNY